MRLTFGHQDGISGRYASSQACRLCKEKFAGGVMICCNVLICVFVDAIVRADSLIERDTAGDKEAYTNRGLAKTYPRTIGLLPVDHLLTCLKIFVSGVSLS